MHYIPIELKFQINHCLQHNTLSTLDYVNKQLKAHKNYRVKQ